MTIEQKKLEAYNEAKAACEVYKNFKGDKRSSTYRRMANNVVDCWMGRMNNFGQQLGLPTFTQYFYNH
jgi:hypothetical protein